MYNNYNYNFYDMNNNSYEEHVFRFRIFLCVMLVLLAVVIVLFMFYCSGTNTRTHIVVNHIYYSYLKPPIYYLWNKITHDTSIAQMYYEIKNDIENSMNQN